MDVAAYRLPPVQWQCPNVIIYYFYYYNRKTAPAQTRAGTKKKPQPVSYGPSFKECMLFFIFIYTAITYIIIAPYTRYCWPDRLVPTSYYYESIVLKQLIENKNYVHTEYVLLRYESNCLTIELFRTRDFCRTNWKVNEIIYLAEYKRNTILLS